MFRSACFLALTGLCVACASERAEPTHPARELAAATARPDSGARPPQAGNPLAFTPRADWVVAPPANSMRVAQYRLPGAAPAGDAQLVVFYFGPEHNADPRDHYARWASQFEPAPDGVSYGAFSERRVLGMPVHEMVQSGTYVAETSPGSGERVHEPGWQLRAAIVESDHGPYFVKLTGPRATVEARAAELTAFLSEIR